MKTRNSGAPLIFKRNIFLKKQGFQSSTIYPNDVASRAHSVMSYSNYAPHNGQFGATPLLLDLLALQLAYPGATSFDNPAYGNTSYTLSRDSSSTANSLLTIYRGQIKTIWDNSGTNSLIGSDYTSNDPGLILDLRPGRLSSVGAKHNLSLAYGSIFHNAAGGGAGDVLIGNQVINVLLGNGGNDTLDGGTAENAGVSSVPQGRGDNAIDWLEGGDGTDTYILYEGGAQDIVSDTGLGDGVSTDILRFYDKQDGLLPFEPVIFVQPDGTWRSSPSTNKR
jgi:hypothetical protein